MKVQQQYNCFSESIYNTAFGSLLTGNIDKSKEDNQQCLQNRILQQTHEPCNSYTQLYNWNIDHNLQAMIKSLVNFLDEFLCFTSSIIQCKQIHFQFPLQKIVNATERIHQLRLTLLIQINNINGTPINSTDLDIPSISFILHELASLIHCLNKEQQQQFKTNISHPQTMKFTQLLDCLAKTIQSCMNCINKNCNSQYFTPSIPTIFPCNGFNMYVPWLPLEQMRISDNKSPMVGLIYGIKDKNIRQKLGYNTIERKSSKRRKQTKRKESKTYKRNNILNDEKYLDNNHEWIINSIDDQIPFKQQRSVTSVKEKVKSIKPKESNEQNTTETVGSHRTLFQQQSIAKSKQSSPLFSSNSKTNESIKLHSIYESKTSGSITPNIKSQTDELPTTSMPDHNESQHTSFRKNQQQESNIYEDDDDDKSALWSPLSFQTYEYRTPSKNIIKISPNSNQDLSSIHNKSISSQNSHKIPSKNDSSDNIDASSMYSSYNKIKPNDVIEQHLTSPSSIISAKGINNTHLKQNITNDTSSLKVTERPQSAEGIRKLITTPDKNKRYLPTSNLSLVNTSQQQNASGTNDTKDSAFFLTATK